MNRSRVEIILDILSSIGREENPSRTTVTGDAHLDPRFAKHYLGLLLDQGFIQTSIGPRGNTVYHLTRKGEEWAEDMKSLLSQLGDKK